MELDGAPLLALRLTPLLTSHIPQAKTALSDPGILPRALDETPERKWVDDLYEDGGGEGEDGRGGWRAEPKWVRIGEGIVPSKCEFGPGLLLLRSLLLWLHARREAGDDAGRSCADFLSDAGCETCHTYRPPRTSHCRLCDNCVLGTDHHCTFLNTASLLAHCCRSMLTVLELAVYWPPQLHSLPVLPLLRSAPFDPLHRLLGVAHCSPFG